MINVFNTILEMSIKAAIVIAFILIARVFLRNVPKKFSYLLWSVAAFRLCIPYSFKSIVSIFNIGDKANVGEQISNTVNKIPLGRPVGNVNIGDSGIVNSPVINIPNGNVGNGASGSVDMSPVTEGTNIDWGVLLTQIAVVLWIIGIAAMVLWGMISYIKTYKRMQNAILYKDNIYFSDKISSPFSMGFIKPKIYLPFGLSADEQVCIIEHEKCHIKRFDHIVKLFAYLLLCLHWFNPMCWVAFDRMGYDMEMSCDEMVFRNGFDLEKKKVYSKALLNVGTRKRFPAPTPVNFDGISNTKNRIKHILKLKKTRIWIKAVCYVLCAVVLIACGADVKNSVDTATDDEATLIADAIDNKIKVIDENGKKAFIKDMDCDYIMQAFVDMDGDGKQEAVLELSHGQGYVILRYYNGEIYAYYMVYRSFLYLKTDGTYCGSSGAGDNGIYRMSFDGSIMKEIVVAESQYVYDIEDELYSINGESVSKEEFDDFYEKWQQKEEVVFAIKYKYSVFVTQPNGKQYTATVGFEADKAYLDISGTDSEYRLDLDLYSEDNIGNAVMQPYAVDVTFDGNTDILIPFMNTNAAMYYSAFVWDESTQKFKYVPHFENFPNFVLDTENKRILAHRQGDMENYYAYCRFDGDDFITTNCVFFECIDPENYTYEFSESKYEGGVWTDVAEYNVTGHEYYSVEGISAELNKYYEHGSFWDLNNSAKWRGVQDIMAVTLENPTEEFLAANNYTSYVDEEYDSEVLMFKANTDVIDFKFVSVEYIEGSGNYVVGDFLYSQPELTVGGDPCVVYTQIQTIPDRGIMFSYSNGETEAYAIVDNTKDGGYILSRIYEKDNLITDKLYVEFEIGAATEEMIRDDRNIHFVDNTDRYGYKNADLYIKAHLELKNFKFLELDESEDLRVGKTLYEKERLDAGEVFIVSTYVNDVTYNRGFSYVDEHGDERYYAFWCDMSGQSDLPFEIVEITDMVGIKDSPEIDIVKGKAFRFCDAYLNNNIETARALMDTPSNECLECFENNINQYNSIECGEITVTNTRYNYSGILSAVYLEIPFYETREGYEGVTYMVMTLLKSDGNWVITFFDFDA